MSSSNFASSFAPYTPPPDDPTLGQSSAPVYKPSRPWFPVHTSSLNIDTSYQSGGVPTFGTSAAGGSGAVEAVESQANQWETRYGARVDMLSAWAYMLGPVSALVILMIETHNDYVRYHAYQSALLTTPIVVLRIFVSLLQFTPWIRTFLTLCIFLPAFSMAFIAHRGANKNGLARFQLPVIGPLAERWVAEE